ncbi:hypothetical protein LC653_43970 [Nostoc sp. CHAB 5784]|uniref:hypothetical protein n=1 Tax=Nostoc mirabile TaxID=2907820 RepID=UPI001E487F0A|nr:hypothetical protein [Nostoc mirabile]MCC5670551.1 hypothetical protein [Nostoc mirabile CHAB5784]
MTQISIVQVFQNLERTGSTEFKDVTLLGGGESSKKFNKGIPGRSALGANTTKPHLSL